MPHIVEGKRHQNDTSSGVWIPEAIRSREAWLIAGVLWGLVVVGTFLPPSYAWGFNHLRFLPVPTALFLVLFPLILGLLASSFARLPFPVPIPMPIAAIGLALVAGLTFSLLRAETWLLGDGILRLQDLFAGQGIIFRLPEPLESSLHSFVFRALSPVEAWTVYREIAIVVGATFFSGLWLLSKRWWPEHPTAWLPVAALFFSGAAMQYYGYVENYVITTSLSLLFVMAGYHYLRDRVRFPWVLLIYANLVLAHFSTLALLPALIYLFIAGKEWQRGTGLLWNVAPLVWAALFVYWIKTGSAPADPRMTSLDLMVPLLKEPNGYTLFSIKHLSDWMNQQVLVAAPGLLLVARRLVRHPWRDFTTTRENRFLVLCIAIGWGFQFLLDSSLGMARDWDLFTWGSMPLLAAGILWAMDDPPARPRSWMPVLAAVATLALGYVFVNHSETASIARFETLLQGRPVPAASGYENLATWVLQKHDKQRSAEYLRHATQLTPENSRYLYYLALMEFELNNTAAGENAAAQAIGAFDGKKPGFAITLVEFLLKRKHYAEAHIVLGKALSVNSDNLELLKMDADVLYRLGQVDSVLVRMRRIWSSRQDDPTVIANALELSLALHDTTDLRLIAAAGARGSSVEVWRSAALAFDFLGEPATALSLLRRYLASPQAEVSPELEQKLSDLEKRSSSAVSLPSPKSKRLPLSP